MDTLSNGYLKPESPDTGDVFFAAIATNAQKANDHKHDGTLGEFNTPESGTLSSASWAAVAGQPGTYRQLVTLSGTRQYDETCMEFRISTGERVYPKVEKVSANTFYVYTNDSSLTYHVKYYG